MTAVPIFILTVSLALLRPRIGSLRIDHPVAAIIGATLSIIVGAVPITSVPHILSILVHPIITIVSLMVITLIAEHAGLFGLLSVYIAKAARGDGRKLFTYIFLAGSSTPKWETFGSGRADQVVRDAAGKITEDVEKRLGR